MTQFTLKLVEDQDNPVIILDSFHNATALIDTGSKKSKLKIINMNY